MLKDNSLCRTISKRDESYGYEEKENNNEAKSYSCKAKSQTIQLVPLLEKQKWMQGQKEDKTKNDNGHIMPIEKKNTRMAKGKKKVNL